MPAHPQPPRDINEKPTSKPRPHQTVTSQGCLRPGWEDGASPTALLVGTAAALRAGRRAADEEAAERLAVRLVVPLGLCHLPAFVVLGIAPVVASVGLDLVHG